MKENIREKITEDVRDINLKLKKKYENKIQQVWQENEIKYKNATQKIE